MPTEFFAFDLLISRPWPGGRAYRAHLVRSPAGEAKGKLRWPRKAVLRGLLADLGHPGGGAVRAALLGSLAASQAVRDAVRVRTQKGALDDKKTVQLGEILYQFLFPGRILQCLRQSLAVAQLHRVGLALRMHLSAAPELAALPWEYLFDPQNRQFLVQSADVEVARTLGRDPSLIQPPAAKLRILFVAANPFRDLNLQREERELREMADGSAGRIEITILTPPTLTQLRRILRNRQFDVIHFAGHGSFRKSDSGGALALERDGGGHEWIPANTLASILRDNSSLRLVVLNTCRSGQQAPSAPLPGIAEALILHEIRSAVAMQAPISDDAAIAFSRGFYEAYAETRSIAHAMASGRDEATASGMEWGIPCLFTREGAMASPPPLFSPASLSLVVVSLAPFAFCMFFHLHHDDCQALAITYPSNYAKVDDQENIRGTSCRLPTGQEPWIIVYSSADNLYYPYRFKIDANEGWESLSTKIGSSRDAGKQFEIIAALADAQSGRSLFDGAAGMLFLPDGVKVYQRINVVRR